MEEAKRALKQIAKIAATKIMAVVKLPLIICLIIMFMAITVINIWFDFTNMRVSAVDRAIGNVIQQSVRFEDGLIIIPHELVMQTAREHLTARGLRASVLLRNEELFTRMVEAEVVTSFPRTHRQEEEDCLKGSVFIKRGEDYLTYLNYDTFRANAGAAQTRADFEALRRIFYG